jgi:hypothetical protein
MVAPGTRLTQSISQVPPSFLGWARVPPSGGGIPFPVPERPFGQAPDLAVGREYA